MDNSVYRVPSPSWQPATTETAMSDNKMALVLGATGGIGGEMARRLAAAGWTVRALHRDPQRVACGDGSTVTWLAGDAHAARRRRRGGALGPADRSCRQPAGLPQLGQSWCCRCSTTPSRQPASGRAHRAAGYGLQLRPGRLSADRARTPPQQPATRKGAIRVEMERRLHAATADGAREPRGAGRRLLRSARRQQLVLAGAGRSRAGRSPRS